MYEIDNNHPIIIVPVMLHIIVMNFYLYSYNNISYNINRHRYSNDLHIITSTLEVT